MKDPYNLSQELIGLRRHFHQYPELALKENKTSGFIRDYLERLGYEVRSVQPTGLIAELPQLKNRTKTVVLRAEMDGLPVTEQTGLPYSSCNPGVMHACGHDYILAVALILTKIVSLEKDAFPVRIRFLFEPAEEIGEGTLKMISAGAMDDPVPDAFLMFHYAADKSFGMAVHKGQASSMICEMKILIQGRSSHWCQAEKGVDAIHAAAQVVNAIYDLNASYGKEYPAAGKYVTGIGTIHGGEYANIIADHVELNGSIRAVREEDFNKIKEKIENILKKTGESTRTEISMVFPKDPVYPFANDDGLTDIASCVGKEVFGKNFLLEGEEELFLSGDNAYRYFKKTKGLFCVFLAGIPGESYPLHHPKFQLDEKILPYSVEALHQIMIRIGTMD